MSLIKAEKEILKLIQNKRLNYQGIFELIYEEKLDLNDDFIEQMEKAFIDNFTNQLNNSNEDGRIDHLKGSIKSFKAAFKSLIKEFRSEIETEKLVELKENVVRALKIKLKLLKGYEKKELPNPININCTNVVLAAFFQELTKEISNDKKLDRRISHLISDNFLSKKGTAINVETTYKELIEGGGITQKAKDELRIILEKILKRLN